MSGETKESKNNLLNETSLWEGFLKITINVYLER